uniref:Uncharacterized protein n=1 Tax=viral metagenome TaxID=1070528 RepID=A0A6C0DAH5_9ZZZZ
MGQNNRNENKRIEREKTEESDIYLDNFSMLSETPLIKSFFSLHNERFNDFYCRTAELQNTILNINECYNELNNLLDNFKNNIMNKIETLDTTTIVNNINLQSRDSFITNLERPEFADELKLILNSWMKIFYKGTQLYFESYLHKHST